MKNKRAQFTKDINKLISGDYVLVPKHPTQEMLDVAWEAPPVQSGMTRRHLFEQSIIAVYKAMINAAQGVEANG
ncbi:hypothetical protein WCE00_01665 [Acinetobacter haemolyticus]|uniref:hypothetical protein n=1 Tax=Acinetobacter haemolyticus TaxID=29430 RepID=UPI0034D64A73